jgi:hypothetical protein
VITLRLLRFLSLSGCTYMKRLHQANHSFPSAAYPLILEFRMNAWTSVYTPSILNSLHHLFKALSEIPRSLALCVLVFPLVRKQLYRLLLEFFRVAWLGFPH